MMRGIRHLDYPLPDTSILLLEDSLELGALTMDVLRLAGYDDVRHVVNNEDAIAALEDQAFDVCIFDLRLKGATCEAAADVAFDHHVPLILTSGSSLDLPSLSQDYLFLEKPTVQNDLTDAITKVLATP